MFISYLRRWKLNCQVHHIAPSANRPCSLLSVAIEAASRLAGRYETIASSLLERGAASTAILVASKDTGRLGAAGCSLVEAAAAARRSALGKIETKCSEDVGFQGTVCLHCRWQFLNSVDFSFLVAILGTVSK